MVKGMNILVLLLVCIFIDLRRIQGVVAVPFGIIFNEHFDFNAVILIPSTNESFPSQTAMFGPRIGGVMTGEVVRAWGDSLGCESFHDFGDEASNRTMYKGKIILVQKGNCSFASKVRKVQEVGGIAVIVGDNRPNSRLEKMSDSGYTLDITIPSIFVSMASYLSLCSLLSVVGPIEIEIVPETPDLAILDVVVLLLLVFTLAIIYIVIAFHGRYEQLAPLKIVQYLPRGRWTRDNTIQQLPSGAPTTLNRYGYHFHPHRPMALECVICLEDFKEGDIVLSLPCDHDFHVGCITPWLTMQHPICPLCKRDIIHGHETTNENSPLINAFG